MFYSIFINFCKKKLRIIPKIMKTLENPEKNGEEEPKAQEAISKLKGEE